MIDLAEQMRRKFDDDDAGVAFRAAHGIDRESWIAAQVASGMSAGRARDRCRRMANEALVAHRLRECERVARLGRGYSLAADHGRVS